MADRFDILYGEGVIKPLHAMHISKPWMDYLIDLNAACEAATGIYDPLLGQPAKPRVCAYCGTKNAAEARCESCGAPNR